MAMPRHGRIMRCMASHRPRWASALSLTSVPVMAKIYNQFGISRVWLTQLAVRRLSRV